MVDCVFLCLAFHLVTRPESLALGRVYFLPGTCACWGASGGQSHRRASQALVKPQKASWSSLSGSANSQGSLSEGASAHQGSLSPQPSLLVSTRNILFQRRLPGPAWDRESAGLWLEASPIFVGGWSCTGLDACGLEGCLLYFLPRLIH